ncbi:hypothetical protein [Salinibacter altiplanensis]|uniref:hypothetical protein n=1 Tax=Salinibacter altiplanensis TaxID=1803181 RepID=UPI001319C674|nr:hypothetical protein [Salinibacter altiplanensis]
MVFLLGGKVNILGSQMIKEQDEKDRVTRTKKKAIFGEEEILLEILRSIPPT